MKEVETPRGSEKQPIQSASAFLKTPPQEEVPGLPEDAPSMLHLIQVGSGGFHITSVTFGALGCLMVTLKAFRMVKSLMELLEALLLLQPDKDVLDIIDEIADFQLMQLLLNLASFLAYQIELIRKTIAYVMTNLH